MSKILEIEVNRKIRSKKSTIGELSVDGVFECYTLEDVEREEKIYGETAIPKGTYKVSVTMSNRFKRLLPLLQNVPGFEGIRIHPGNVAADTHGCILVGTTKGIDQVLTSKVAFAKLFAKIEAAIKDGKEIKITVK
jgi:hypothetical protein